MTDTETYIRLLQALLFGVGLGWFFAGLAQPFRVLFGLAVMALFIAASVGVRYL